jgi:hypothetical protein
MIVIDYNGIAIAGVITQKMDVDENLIRHMILNTIRMYNKKYREEYGQVVIACDASSWRKEVFPQYKASRKKGREESTTDWNEIFRIINQVREDLRYNFPYKVVHVDRCEADDVIGALVENTQEFGHDEKVMIISADKDFIQLHRHNNVRQFSPMQKKFVQDKNPRKYLFEHIMKGDSGDGVPNILSPDNAFTDSIRQSPVTQKKLDTWMASAEDLEAVLDTEAYRNYCRNKMLIDLSSTPKELREQIISTYENQPLAHRSKVLNYLIKNRCKLLIECVEEFY